MKSLKEHLSHFLLQKNIQSLSGVKLKLNNKGFIKIMAEKNEYCLVVQKCFIRQLYYLTASNAAVETERWAKAVCKNAIVEARLYLLSVILAIEKTCVALTIKLRFSKRFIKFILSSSLKNRIKCPTV